MTKHGKDGEAADGFLDRWSRRKRESRTAPLPAEQPPAADPAEAAKAPAKSDAEILEELGLPDPETLGAGDDFSGFMAKAVPEHLRRQALRQLWGSNPVLANLDELLDYGEDFTNAATVVENLQTAWQVGRGFRTDEPETTETAEATLAEPERGPDAAVETATEDGAIEKETVDAEHGAEPPQLEEGDAVEGAATGNAVSAGLTSACRSATAVAPRRRIRFG